MQTKRSGGVLLVVSISPVHRGGRDRHDCAKQFARPPIQGDVSLLSAISAGLGVIFLGLISGLERLRWHR